MKKLTPFVIFAASIAGAQEYKSTLNVGFENEYSIPNGHLQTRYISVTNKFALGWYAGIRLQEIELFRSGAKTFDKNVILNVGGPIAKDVEFEVWGAPRLSGNRVAPWFGGELRLKQGPLVLHVGARHYDANPDVNDYRFGFDYYWDTFRLAGEVIAPDRFSSATFRGWFDHYYDENGSVVGIFAAGPSASGDLSVVGGRRGVNSTTIGLRATHMFNQQFGVSGAIELSPVRTLGFGFVIRF